MKGEKWERKNRKIKQKIRFYINKNLRKKLKNIVKCKRAFLFLFFIFYKKKKKLFN